MFFILGTGRCGTTSLASSLSTINGICCLHEPEPILIEESSQYLYSKMTSEEIVRILHQTRKTKVKGDMYGESNQCLSFIVEPLLEAFPDAKFVWILRNGIDFVNSAYNKKWYIDEEKIHLLKNDGLRRWASSRIQANKLGIMSNEHWGQMDQFEKCCWYWVYTNDLIEKKKELIKSKNFFFLKLEDINNKYPELVRFLGFTPNFVRPPFRFNLTRKEGELLMSWTDKQQESFIKICGAFMDKYYPGWIVDGKIQKIKYDRANKYNLLLGKLFRWF